MFYIMNASSLHDNKAAAVADTIDASGGDLTIIAVNEDGKKKRFITGSGQSGYDLVAGDHLGYKVDTGLGYGGTGSAQVEGVATVDRDGKVTVISGEINLTEKRRHWVMK